MSVYLISGDLGGFSGKYYHQRTYKYCTKVKAIRMFKELHGIRGIHGVNIYVNGVLQ